MPYSIRVIASRCIKLLFYSGIYRSIYNPSFCLLLTGACIGPVIARCTQTFGVNLALRMGTHGFGEQLQSDAIHTYHFSR